MILQYFITRFCYFVHLVIVFVYNPNRRVQIRLEPLSYHRLSDEEVEEWFEELIHFLTLKTETAPKIPAEVQAHQIMRSAAEKIHVAFRGLNQDLHVRVKTITLLKEAILEAIISLFRMTRVCVMGHLQTLSS